MRLTNSPIKIAVWKLLLPHGVGWLKYSSYTSAEWDGFIVIRKQILMKSSDHLRRTAIEMSIILFKRYRNQFPSFVLSRCWASSYGAPAAKRLIAVLTTTFCRSHVIDYLQNCYPSTENVKASFTNTQLMSNFLPTQTLTFIPVYRKLLFKLDLA
jgi:hypothetical protein